MLGITIDKMFVNFIGEDDDVLIKGDVTEGAKLVCSVDRSSGITWGVEDDHLGAAGHVFLELLRSNLPVVFRGGLNKNRLSTCETNHLWIAHPIR